MKKIFPFLFFSIIAFTAFISKSKEKFPTPPNGTLIADNLYIDKTEMSNIDWKEYVYWLKKVYGETSDIYLESLLDTTVWRTERGYNEPYVEVYHTHPSYNDYPLVGVSYEQAVNYSKWRSDRVYEMMLIAAEAIEPNYNQDNETVFTKEKYLKGNYMDYTPDKSVLIPNFRLPTKEEWETAAANGLDLKKHPFGVDRTTKQYHKKLAKSSFPYNTLDASKYSEAYLGRGFSITAPTRSYSSNSVGIYNMIGNVAEMTATYGVAKGGSWEHDISECQIMNDLEYKEAQRWLGFRNVCSWETPKEGI